MTARSNENQMALLPLEESRPFAQPVLISACFLGIPFGGMPTPRTSESMAGVTGAKILNGKARLIAPEAGKDMTRFHIAGARYTLELARIVGARRAYLKGGSPSCDREGVTGELLRRAGIEVIRVA